MATDVRKKDSDEYIFPKYFFIHLRIKSYLIFRNFRLIILYLAKVLRTRSLLEQRRPSVTPRALTDQEREFLQKNDYVFMENIFPAEVHKNILRDWPAFFYFDPVRDIHKCYDKGWLNKTQTCDFHPWIGALHEFFSGKLEDSQKWLDGLPGSKSRVMNRALFLRAFSGSSVIAHLDSVSKDRSSSDFLNLIFYVDGTGGYSSGGTQILDKETRAVVFEPVNLTNTCLIYRSGVLPHKMERMRRGSFRKAFTADAVPEGVI